MTVTTRPMTRRPVRFGRTELPERQREVLRRAIRLEWITIGFLVVSVTLVR